MYTAPYGVFAVEDYEVKYYTLLRLAAGQDISLIATVNPSTIVLLADRLARHTESIIRGVRDGPLAAVGCWKGGTVGAYLATFDDLFPQRPPVRAPEGRELLPVEQLEVGSATSCSSPTPRCYTATR
jgi:hypothetical protein